MTGKILALWIGGNLREVVAHEVSTITVERLKILSFSDSKFQL